MDWAIANGMLTGRCAQRRKLGNNTWLERRTYGGRGPEDIAVKFHRTDVVTYHKDGTQTLNTKGWRSMTTNQRLHAYSAARLGSARNVGWVIYHASDPLTAPRVTRCRVCHGSGGHFYAADPPRFERVRADWVAHPDNYHSSNYWGAEYVRVMVYPGTLAQEWAECWQCKGAGTYDYGSNPDPIVFEDGIRVSSRDGHVIGARSHCRVSQIAASAARKARKLAKAERAHARLVTARTAAAQRTGDGVTLYFKGVTRSLLSPVQMGREMCAYLPGSDVTADGYNADPVAACGRGVNFCETIADAMEWSGSDGLVVAITIPDGVPYIKALDGNKWRAPRVHVVGPVAKL